MASSPKEVIDMLKTAYSMELETVMNYLANSTNLDGVRAEEIKKSLAADVPAELAHAQQIGQRIKQLGGLVPGSTSVKLGGQKQPSENTTDVVGVIEIENVGPIDSQEFTEIQVGEKPLGEDPW